MEPTQPRLDRRALDPAFALAASQVADGTVPWVTVGVAGAAGLIRLESYGPTDGERVGVDARCLLASVTKPMVAAAVLHEVEAGRIDLGTPLSAWWPPLASTDLRPFSAWHVLTHTTGLGDVDIETLLRRGGDRAELLRQAMAGPQATAPGSTFSYASTTFDLLVEAVAARLGRPFDDVLRANVLDPLGMAGTSFEASAQDHPNAPVRVDLPGLAGVPPALLLAGWSRLRLAGGGLWSTADDVLRFGRAMLRGGELDGARVLSPAFVELMTREVTVDGLGAAEDVQRAEHYAIGWGTRGVSSVASASAFGHGGATGTRLWVDPAHDLVFVYLSGIWEMPHEPINAVQHAVYAALPDRGVAADR